MQIALVGDNRRTAEPGLRGQCPACRAEVIPKCGELIVHHWAHRAAEDCDRWAEPESAWHASWKTAAPLDRREVVKAPHRADVIAGDGVICELQHSSISVDDVRERERFYGRDMRWLFDARDKEFVWEPMDNGSEPHRWKIHRKHAWPTLGVCQRRVMLDFGDEILSCEYVNATGSYASGYVYPPRTVRMWLGGPDYPEGWRSTAPIQNEGTS